MRVIVLCAAVIPSKTCTPGLQASWFSAYGGALSRSLVMTTFAKSRLNVGTRHIGRRSDGCWGLGTLGSRTIFPVIQIRGIGMRSASKSVKYDARRFFVSLVTRVLNPSNVTPSSPALTPVRHLDKALSLCPVPLS